MTLHKKRRNTNLKEEPSALIWTVSLQFFISSPWPFLEFNHSFSFLGFGLECNFERMMINKLVNVELFESVEGVMHGE